MSFIMKPDDYIPLPERAYLVEKARVEQKPLKLPLKTLVFPGFKGEPSVLPDGPKRKK